MSWDVVIFNSRQKINVIEEIDEAQFVPLDFDAVMKLNFQNIIATEDHREIVGADFSIDYFISTERVGHLMLSLYGENAIFELINIAKANNWQIFDTGSGDMLNLQHPEQNGYKSFQNYLQQVINGRNA